MCFMYHRKTLRTEVLPALQSHMVQKQAIGGRVAETPITLIISRCNIKLILNLLF